MDQVRAEIDDRASWAARPQARFPSGIRGIEPQAIVAEVRRSRPRWAALASRPRRPLRRAARRRRGPAGSASLDRFGRPPPAQRPGPTPAPVPSQVIGHRLARSAKSPHLPPPQHGGPGQRRHDGRVRGDLARSAHGGQPSPGRLPGPTSGEPGVRIALDGAAGTPPDRSTVMRAKSSILRSSKVSGVDPPRSRRGARRGAATDHPTGPRPREPRRRR